MLTCAFDQTQHETLEALHDHLRRFKVSRERYYHQYYPRYDPVTNELIPFRDYDQYHSQEFANKVTLKKWLKANPEKGWEWAKGWLGRRKTEKGLVYAPSQTELRTCTAPSMPYYDQIGASEGGYYGITARLGYAPRYTAEPLIFTPLDSRAAIIQDSREQAPLKLTHTTRVEALNVGDYALAPPYDLGIRIERKSLGDFCGTLSERKIARKGGRKGDGATEDSSFQRFDRELSRATEQGLYVIMMVEDRIEDALHFDYLPHTRWVRASPSYIFHNLRTLLTKYPLSFQCVFCDGRAAMSKTLIRILELGDQARRVDLQYRLEKGEL